MTSSQEKQPLSLALRDPAFKLISAYPKPEFMVVGSAKCGTTSLSSYLPIHPQIKACTPKEPNYWSWKACDKKQYQSLFVNAQPATHPSAGQQIGGEYSTSYLLHPLVPRRVRARLPELKVIILLRNPIDRAYSHFVMAKRGGSEPECSFEEIIEREIEQASHLLEAHQRGFLDSSFRTSAHRCQADGTPISVVAHNRGWTQYALSSDEQLFQFYRTSYVFRSIYHDQVWRWLQLYPAMQVKIVDSERLMTERRAVLEELSAFLNIEPYTYSTQDIGHTWGGGSNEHNTPGDYQSLSTSTRDRLSAFFLPYNTRLFELIGRRFSWE